MPLQARRHFGGTQIMYTFKREVQNTVRRKKTTGP